MRDRKPASSPFKKALRRTAQLLGPGLITGASDDDPSGIATCSQTGAQFGYGMLWTAVYFVPFLIAVQEACARIGTVTGKGIVTVVRDHYSRRLAFAVMALVLIANIVNVGADIGAMAAAAALVIPLNHLLLTVLFSLSILIVVYTSYRTYVRILKWFALAMLAYVVTVFLVKEPWLTLLKATFIPRFELSFPFLFLIMGVMGTTVSPYMFFWEAEQEVEEVRDKHLLRGPKKPRITSHYVEKVRQDNALGMVISNITTWCIIVTAATILHNHGITDIKSSADAARALEPLVHGFPNAGFLAKLIFATGIIGLGLLTVPVLSASASYTVAAAFAWPASLNYKVRRARGFYAVMVIATFIGLLVNLIGIHPVKLLVFASVLNGVIAVPFLFLILLITDNGRVMGKFKNGWLSRLFLWLTFILMGLSTLAMVYSFIKK